MPTETAYVCERTCVRACVHAAVDVQPAVDRLNILFSNRTLWTLFRGTFSVFKALNRDLVASLNEHKRGLASLTGGAPTL